MVHLLNVNNKDELFEQLSNKLKLPDYFGFNWDALYSCLTDLHWVKQQGVVLVHDSIPAFDEKNMASYIKTLNEAVKDWREGEEHFLEVVFPEQDKDLIQKHCL